jgi:ureidoglycolate lyase
MTHQIQLEPLTAKAFAPFGDVVDPPALGERAALSETLATSAATPRLSFSHMPPWDLPLTATQMERHLNSAQCFIPVDVARYVILVAPDANAAPDPTGLRAFVASGDQAVNYHRGTWHHPQRPLDRPGRFAVLMWTTGRREDDEEWATLADPVLITL